MKYIRFPSTKKKLSICETTVHLRYWLARRHGRSEVFNTLTDALNKIFEEFTPDLVFYIAGIDPLETDHFDRLSITLNGLWKRERLDIETVTQKEIPMVLLLSEGYAPTLRQTIEAHAITYHEAEEISRPYFH